MEFKVYIIHNKDRDKYYIGQTYDLEKRILEHNSGLSNFTSKYKGIWEVVYTEIYTTRTEAIKREIFLKKQKNKDFYKRLCKMDD
ncbi:MAG: endonuclease [Candidatus Moranbacteria bacterium CG10_big_fil_rev_8_21_14_0_10_35_21]|nr:MAG: endonuclease [Candidatus Moranbacteria bacterium CG10_big_fil_rev_8_21_14_0_10_35_21]PJA88658.1 MAG: endonuclease [Candidatus Moranbacteria bacterium CG_4_9_14_3_um_filter_36_9]